MNTTRISFTLAAIALSIASASAMAAIDPINQADVVASTDADRTVTITPDTQYVNVMAGDTINFVSNGQSFAVKFDGTQSAFLLNSLAPAGALGQDVAVYVSRDVVDQGH